MELGSAQDCPAQRYGRQTMMSSQIDYRKRFLHIVETFLEGTPSSIGHGLRALERMPRPDTSSLNGLMWGPYFSMLSDCEYHQSREFLRQLQGELSGASRSAQRTYLNYDFRPEMTTEEHDWYLAVESLLVFVREMAGAPEKVMPSSPEALTAAYQRRTTEINEIMERQPTAALIGDERIPSFVLHQVSTVITNLDILTSKHRGFLIPDGIYSSFVAYPNNRFAPNASACLDWAERAMQAISGRGWLLIMWQVRGACPVFSLV
jgi:hypothetical protein